MATTQVRETTGDIQESAAAIGDAMSDRLSDVAETAGEVVRGAGEVVRDADRTLRGSSDQVLGIVAALSVGLAVGFVLSGSSRLLVAASLVPAAMVAGILVERMDRDSRTSARSR